LVTLGTDVAQDGLEAQEEGRHRLALQQGHAGHSGSVTWNLPFKRVAPRADLPPADAGPIMGLVSPGPSDESFLTTRWSLVRGAAGGDAERAHAALTTLCRTYWFPLYAFVRRKGVPAQDAEDVVQGFFARLLDKRALGQVTPEKGRFRSFLLASIQNHLANLRDAQRTLKRGGGQAHVEIDFADADARYQLQARLEDPQRAFERAWALELLARALNGLEQEYRASDRGALFDVLKPELTGAESSPYASYAAQLCSTESAVKVAVHRLRRRYRERLRATIAETVQGEQEIEAEIADLFLALGER
jgi:RNA polymerase sigma-70 factor (ECF subfamily)